MKLSEFYTKFLGFKSSDSTRITDKALLFINALNNGFNLFVVIPILVSFLMSLLPFLVTWVMKRKYAFYSPNFEPSKNRDCYKFVKREFVKITIIPAMSVNLPKRAICDYFIKNRLHRLVEDFAHTSLGERKICIEFKRAIYYWSPEKKEFFAESESYAKNFMSDDDDKERKIVRYTFDKKEGKSTHHESINRTFIFEEDVYPCLPRLLNAIDNWKENIDLYKKLGNSKLGILLYGQPGCGKSSMAFAIAQHLGYKRISMATLNLAGIFEFPEEDKSVVVFDDIDVLFSSDREKGPAQNDFEQKKAETLDDLMKFLDSDRCPESVVIFTTNYPERFDKALFRHGRINLRLELKPLPVENIISFTKKWYKIDSFPSSIEKIIHPMPFAHLSNIIRQNIGNFDSFCQELEETFKSEENS